MKQQKCLLDRSLIVAVVPDFTIAEWHHELPLEPWTTVPLRPIPLGYDGGYFQWPVAIPSFNK